MKKITATAIALTVAMSAGAAFADHHEGHDESTFQMLDTNGDGMISVAEWGDKDAVKFTQIDTNGDGNISKEEMAASMHKKAEEKVEEVTPAAE